MKKNIYLLVVILVAFLSIQATSGSGAFTWIGRVKLSDTLSGNLKLNHGLYLGNDSINDVTDISTLRIRSLGGIKFGDVGNNVSDDGGRDMYYNSIANHYFQILTTPKMVLSTGGLSLFLPTDSLRWNDANHAGSVSVPDGYLTLYVNGGLRYIQLYKSLP